MAQMMTVRLNRGDAPNWGFRLQGGKDFGTPLVVQKVNGGSPAERAGLSAGDSVIKINNTEVFNLRHKDAQDVIVRAGPTFEITVQRGGSTWRPSVQPVGSIYQQSTPSINNVQPVTKTSLAAKNQSNVGAIGTGHNLAAKPFNTYNGTSNGTGPRLVNKQYNSPVGLYSEESIKETISAQTEVLSGGCLGVNFKKNEKDYDSSNSAVYRMLQEAENDHNDGGETEPDSGVVTASNRGVAGLRHVAAPENKPQQPKPQLPPGQNICADCERLIVGVFVRIKDKNLHVECFKCATCGTSLKNVGYYNINNKLYCDIHAKLAAKNSAPGPNLLPVTVPPGGRIPAGTISAALSGHALPQTPLSPNAHPISSAPFSPSANLSGPRPFSSVSAPLSSPSYKPSSVAPLSPVAPAPEKSERYVNIVWPPVPEHSDLPTACPLYFPPPSNVDHAPKEPQLVKAPDREQRAVEEVHESQSAMANAGTPKMSICSEEVYNLSGRRSTMECLETITDSIQTQIFVDGILKERPRSPPPPPVDRDITVQPTTQLQEKEQDVKQEDEQALRRSSVELRRPNDFERALKARKSLENVVPKQWESQMLRALTTISPPSSSSSSDAFAQIPAKHSRTPLAEALSIAPKESYLHLTTTLEAVPLPEETEPYFPPERPLVVADVGKKPPTEPPEDSKFVKALQTAPDRPFTPVKTAVKKKPRADPLLDDLPKPSEPMTMKAALTTASDRPYTPLVCDPFAVKPLESQAAKEEIKPPPSKPKAVDDRAVPKPFKPVAIETFVPCEEKDRPPSTGFPPVTDGLKAAFDECHADYSQIKSEISSQIVEQTHKEVHFDERSIVAHEEEEVDIEESALCKKCKCSISKKQRAEHKEEKLMRKEVVVEKQAECTVVKKPMNLIGCLHKPEGLPHYQLALDAPPIPMDFAAKRGNPQNVDGNRKPTGDTRNPGNNPNPGTNPHNPGTNPHNPGTNPHNPGTNPHNPGTNPAESNPRITVECETVQTPRRQPLITIDPHDYASGAFRPVADDSNRPGSGGTFSPRPGSLTPSMINKPAPKIPHYQANLVPTEHAAPEVNLFDPKSPAISRSPSPCPPRDRSPSPFRPNTPRPKSPAAVGPPPNPLKDSAQLRAMLQKETKETKEIEEAKRSLETFIPQHKELTEGQRMYAAEVSVRNKRYDDPQAVSQRYREEDVVVREQLHMEEQQQKLQQKLSMYKEQQLQRTEAEREERRTVGESTTSVKERSQMDRVQQTQKETSESVARSADSAVQVQRKRTVTEEFEHTHKEKTIEIQKGGAKTHAFARSSDPLADAPIQAAHVACPQPLDRKFVDKRHASAVDCNQQGVVGLTVTRPKPIASPFLGGGRSNSIPQVHAELNKQDVTVRSGIGIVASSSSAQERQSATQQTADYGKTLLAATSSSVASPSIPPSAPFKPAAKACVTPSKSASASTGPSACVKRPNNLSNPNNNRAGGGSGIGGGGAGGRQAGAIGVAPKRGRGVLNVGGLVGSRVPLCGSCHQSIRGPFITALGKIWCPDHFVCATPSCRRPLQDLGFVEERGQLYCEYCFEQYLAPNCSKCNQKIKGDCLKAIGQNFHPDCFKCIYCGKLFSNSPFFLEDGAPYCENDWNELFTTKCFACGFPVEAGDRWVEALNNNYHSQCFNCTMCKKNLEGQSFVAKGGRPYCKNHAR